MTNNLLIKEDSEPWIENIAFNRKTLKDLLFNFFFNSPRLQKGILPIQLLTILLLHE